MSLRTIIYMSIQYLNQECMSLGGLSFSFATRFRGAFCDDSTCTYDGTGTINVCASVEVHMHMDTSIRPRSATRSIANTH
jgi:hypothetical protein